MLPQFGAYPQDSQTTFVRVWAPHAMQMGVIGDYDAWDAERAVLLAAQANGYWEGVVKGLGPGGRYEFVLTRQDGARKYRLDPAARDTDDSCLDNCRNKSRAVDTRCRWTDFTSPHFDDLIIYQCHIGSFAGRNDGFVTHEQVASFKQVMTKLDYIRELGFNAIEALPIQEFRADRSWGYNPAFYFALESAYGRPADLLDFVDACHSKGLAVLFDVVYNHVSNDDNSFYHFDEAVTDDADSYLGTQSTDWGLAPAFWEQPIKDFFLANMGMYLCEYNGDGLRFDSTRTIEKTSGWGNDGWQFMQYLTWQGKQLFPGKYLIAEHLPDHDSIISSAGFHATWLKEPFDLICDALNGRESIDKIAALLGNEFGPGRIYPYSWNTVKYLLGSHDECGDLKNGQAGHRYFVERFGGRDNWYARAKTRMAWVLNIATKGTPMLFMGNECHMRGYWHDEIDGQGDHRFDWSIAGDWIGMGMRYLVKAANQVRWQHPALRNGGLEITHRDPNGILAFKRWNDVGDLVLVVVNASDTSYTQSSYGVHAGHFGCWQQILCSQDACFGGWDGAGNAYAEPTTQPDGMIYINVPKWSVMMFRLVWLR